MRFFSIQSFRSRYFVALGLVLAAVLAPGHARAQFSASTTTTTFDGTTTTTMFIPSDVTGGGDFDGTIPTNSFDMYTFELSEPRVLVAEITNGFNGCPGDTLLDLRRGGVTGNCSAYGADLPCIAFDDDSGISLCSRLVYQLDPGSYAMRVSVYNGKKLNRYFLHVEFLAPECGNGVVETFEQCDDGNAAGGDCCSAACQSEPVDSPCNDGLLCNGADTCGPNGVCGQHAVATCAGVDGDSNCSESCSDSVGGCAGRDPAGSPCDDGIYCNGTDSCFNGSCSVHTGNPCPGADGDADCSEMCDEQAKACTGSDPNQSFCDDALFCNGSDKCLNGSCSVHTGNSCSGPDADGDCSETCNEESNDCDGSDVNGTQCNDSLYCNGADRCHNGTCSTHTGSPCVGADGDIDCRETCNEISDVCNAPDPDNSPCNDGLGCNGTEKCVAGDCTQHTGATCPGNDGDGDCAESCSDDLEMPGCANPDPNGVACDDGIFCNGPDVCSNGSCSIHLGNPCAGADGDADCSEICSEEQDGCTAPDPNGVACDDGIFCNGTDKCSNGACSVHTGNPCPGADGDADCSETCSEQSDTCSANDPNQSNCNDGLFCNGTDKCLGGTCSAHTGNPCPGVDGDSNCAETCGEASDVCTSSDPNGSTCNDGIFCNGPDSCSAGACSIHLGDPCPGVDQDADCSEICSEQAKACSGNDPNQSSCNDGLFCNGIDTCSNGACSVHAGNPCPGPDGDSNCAEVCNEPADTCSSNDPNGTPCNDSVFCNGTDTCLGGTCSAHSGNPCNGADGDIDCAETCDEAADACSAPDADQSPCDDGLVCNGTDTCLAGQCSEHTGITCPGSDGDGNCSESCSDTGTPGCTNPDPDGVACDDGLFCNGIDTCSGGSCSGHPGNPCPGADGDADCSEACSELADECTSNDPGGSPCDDGIFCNGTDTCAGGSCSVHSGNPCDGVDGDVDCSEGCSEQAKACSVNDPNESSCNDGLFCNGTDTCSNGVCSVHAGNPCPGVDGDSNCAETCNESSDACSSNDPNSSPCDDAIFCNGTDTCSNGACSVHTGNPCPGADGDEDCSEVCSEQAKACSANDPNQSSCTDGLFCNGTDTCSNGACSVHAGDPCPGADGDSNCAETCNENSDLCTSNDPNGSPCDDGTFCNGTDTCAGGMCNLHSGNSCEGADGDIDCSETCDEATETCGGNDPDDSPCDDGLDCNGTENCVAGDCRPHSVLECPGNDGDADCSESCSDTGTPGCTNADPDGAACDDGIFCNGTDMCSGGSCSVHAGDPCPDGSGGDDDADCSESCSEQANTCSANDPNGSQCNDGDLCTVQSTCNGANLCVGGEVSDCDDEDPCTTDACSESPGPCTYTPVPDCTTTTTLPGLVCGDVSGDGAVKATDALAILRAAVGGPQCADKFCICDTNGNGVLAATDALAALKRAVDSPVNLTCACG